MNDENILDEDKIVDENLGEGDKFEALSNTITILGKLTEFDRKWVVRQISYLTKNIVIK